MPGPWRSTGDCSLRQERRPLTFESQLSHSRCVGQKVGRRRPKKAGSVRQWSWLEWSIPPDIYGGAEPRRHRNAKQQSSSVATIFGPPANKLFGPLAKGLRPQLLPDGPLAGPFNPAAPPPPRGRGVCGALATPLQQSLNWTDDGISSHRSLARISLVTWLYRWSTRMSRAAVAAVSPNRGPGKIVLGCQNYVANTSHEVI